MEKMSQTEIIAENICIYVNFYRCIVFDDMVWYNISTIIVIG